MIKIEILGTGCPKCKKLHEIVSQAATDLQLSCDIEHVTDIKRIMAYGVMITPALVIDGDVKFSGKIPSLSDITKLLSDK